MTTASRTRKAPTEAQLSASRKARRILSAAVPCTVVENRWSSPRRFEHVTGVISLEEAAAADLGLVAGDGVAPVLLVLDRPGTCTAFVAVDAATLTLELELAL
jgi:hypothetical protein